MKCLTVLIAAIMPLAIIGCSSKMYIPEVPKMSGNCRADLHTLIKDYVIIIESQR